MLDHADIWLYLWVAFLLSVLFIVSLWQFSRGLKKYIVVIFAQFFGVSPLFSLTDWCHFTEELFLFFVVLRLSSIILILPL